MKRNFLIPAIILFAACSPKQQETVAHITQRRLDDHGRLIISYRFNTGAKWIYDSVEVPNKVIPHDSLQVLYSPEHPENSRLLIP